MMRFNKAILVFVLAIILSSSFASEGLSGYSLRKPTQTSDFASIVEKVTTGMSIGGGVGTSVSYGDLAAYKVFPKVSTWKTYLTTGYSAYIERDIISGLGVRFQFQSGNMKGERRTDIKQVGPLIAFKSNYNAYNLMIRFDFTESILKPNEYRRFNVQGLIGGGLLYFRSYTYYKDLNAWVYRSYGYKEEQNSSGGYTLAGKDKRQMVFTLPISLRVAYRMNYKTDIFVETTLYNTFVDHLDGFDRREFSANDKAAYFGAGICYNFQRSESDLPIKKKAEGDDHSFGGEIHDQDVAKRVGIIRKIFKSDKQNAELEMRLKQYDTELKKLENEYMNEK